MNTIDAASAAVTGARHLRAARNGQDASARWVGSDGVAAIVVCDGCGSGGSSEVGARLGVQLVIRALATRLARGERPREVWAGVRGDVVAALAALVEAMCVDGDRAAVIHEHFLFTIVAAAVGHGEVSVWAIGDGGYALGPRVHELGPFDDNQPPYIAYDLLDAPAEAHVAHADASVGRVVVASDGATELGLARWCDDGLLRNRDALRRALSLAARGDERIDWDAGCVVRAPAALQDDGAVAVLRWAVPS